MNDYKNNQIFFKEEHASKNKKICELLYSFDSNKYIIKNSTGLGATHAMCNYTHGNLIILSPNNSMILGKGDGKYDCKEFYSICGKDQKYKFDQLLIYLNQTPRQFQNAVVNLNAEQLIHARKNKELWELLKGFHCFIDEAHAYTADSSYRKTQGAALELIYNEFTGHKVLSTATPNPFNFDLPREIKFENYYIQREGDRIKRLGYSENLNHARSFILDQVEKRIPVCVFTNNKNIHVSNPIKDVALKYVNLVGVNLNIKIQPYDRGNPELMDPSLFKGADVIFLSSAYFAGFDIKFNCSILILSEQRSHHTKIHVNNAVQAYGRCRHKVQEALYINVPSVIDRDGKKIYIPTSKKEVEIEIKRYYDTIEHTQNQIDKYGPQGTQYATAEGYVNRGEIGSRTLNIINDYFQYNDDKRIELFNSYNFELYTYEPVEFAQTKGKPSTFPDQVRNLYKLEKDLLWDYNTTRSRLKYKDVGNFDYKLSLLTLSIHLIQEYEISPCIQMLQGNTLKPQRFYDTLNKWLRVNCPMDYLTHQLTLNQLNQIKHYKDISHDIDEHLTRDWHMLYSMYCVGSGVYDLEVKKHLRLREIGGDKNIILTANTDRNNRSNLAKRAAIKQAAKEFGPLTPMDLKTIEKVIKSSFKRLDESKNGKYTNMEKVGINQKKVINLHIQLMHMGKGDYANIVKENREYGAITEVGKVLRCLIPLKYLDLDMIAANPQAVDYLYGSNIAFDVYSNVMKNKSMNRNEAKEFYNSLLNNHSTKRLYARSIYINDCGYTPDQAQALSELTAGVESGSFFKKMTQVEDNVMNSLGNYLEVPTLRLHDGLIIPSWLCKNYALPVLFNNFRFHVSYFNSKDDYHGDTTELYERQFMFSDLDIPNPVSEPHTPHELVSGANVRNEMSVVDKILNEYKNIA